MIKKIKDWVTQFDKWLFDFSDIWPPPLPVERILPPSSKEDPFEGLELHKMSPIESLVLHTLTLEGYLERWREEDPLRDEFQIKRFTAKIKRSLAEVTEYYGV